MFVSSCLLDFFAFFYVNDNVINVDVQLVSYNFIYLVNYLIKCLFKLVYWVFCFLFMVLVHDNVINANVQLVSYFFFYSSIGIFSKLFN